MAQLALASVLANENVKAVDVKLDASVMSAIDAALGDVPETDSEKTVSPATRP